MFTLQNIATILSIIVIAAFLSWKEIREYQKRKSYGLEGNPDRCSIHAKAINEIRADIALIKERLNII